MKRPAFQFYPADWRKDAALQSCSVAAQGLWINALCIAHECDPYGHLTVNGKPMNAAQIGRLVGITAKECERLMAELLDAGVSSVGEAGVIFSRRMVRDEDLRNRRATGGAAGAEHGIKGAEAGKKGGRPPSARGDAKPPLEPPPSSSSSSSPSGKEKEPSVLVAGTTYRPPSAPSAEIVELYRQALPQLPGVEVLNASRKRAISARWREVCTDGKLTRQAGLDWFAWFFEHVGKSRFLTGQIPGKSGRTWQADLDFLMTASKFPRVIEGVYHKDAA